MGGMLCHSPCNYPIFLLKQNATFILLLVGALVGVDTYWLCSKDTCLRSSDYSDLHKINIRCVLRAHFSYGSPQKPQSSRKVYCWCGARLE